MDTMPHMGQLAGGWVMPEHGREIGELFEAAVRIDPAGREAWLAPTAEGTMSCGPRLAGSWPSMSGWTGAGS